MRHDGPWLSKLKAFTPMGGAVDLVLDPVASAYAEQNIDALSIDGRWVRELPFRTRSLTPSAST